MFSLASLDNLSHYRDILRDIKRGSRPQMYHWLISWLVFRPGFKTKWKSDLGLASAESNVTMVLRSLAVKLLVQHCENLSSALSSAQFPSKLQQAPELPPPWYTARSEPHLAFSVQYKFLKLGIPTMCFLPQGDPDADWSLISLKNAHFPE